MHARVRWKKKRTTQIVFDVCSVCLLGKCGVIFVCSLCTYRVSFRPMWPPDLGLLNDPKLSPINVVWICIKKAFSSCVQQQRYNFCKQNNLRLSVEGIWRRAVSCTQDKGQKVYSLISCLLCACKSKQTNWNGYDPIVSTPLCPSCSFGAVWKSMNNSSLQVKESSFASEMSQLQCQGGSIRILVSGF